MGSGYAVMFDRRISRQFAITFASIVCGIVACDYIWRKRTMFRDIEPITLYEAVSEACLAIFHVDTIDSVSTRKCANA
jgi:hypothetical protein